MEMMTQLFTEEKEEKEELDNSTEEGIIEVAQEESTEEENNEQPEEVNEEESSSETTQTANASEKSNTKQKSIQSKKTKTANAKSKSLELEKVMDKIDEKIKDVGKNLELKNIVKLKAMSNNDILLGTYNVPFYKPKNIYLDQIDISDNREIYANVNLNKYIADDPIAIRANKINELQIERQQLLIQLEVLKNG
jgi:DNA mismatch repair ATPase MutL